MQSTRRIRLKSPDQPDFLQFIRRFSARNPRFPLCGMHVLRFMTHEDRILAK